MARKKLTEREKFERKWDRRIKKSRAKVAARIEQDNSETPDWIKEASTEFGYMGGEDRMFACNPLAFYYEKEIKKMVENY